MSELAVASARGPAPAARRGGDAGARAALDLANDLGRFLSTVQIGITPIGILTGVFGGEALGGYVAAALAPLPLVGRYADGIGLGIVVALITDLSLIIAVSAAYEIVVSPLGATSCLTVVISVLSAMR